MPILDLQQRLQEVGRIRMGAQQAYQKDGVTKYRPARLPHWRLTSRDLPRLEAVAEIYGGEVKPWEAREGEYEVYTSTDTLRVLIIPGQALSQWWEMWSGGGCTRRCDGEREVLSDGPCLCPADYNERSEASNANPPKACKPTTRLAVLLPEVPGIGHWRLETHGYYAAVELAAAHSLLEEATRRGVLLPARLRIDQRKKLAGGRTTPYPVPVVDLDIALPELMALGQGAGQGEILGLPAAGETGQGSPGFKPVPEEGRGQKPGVAEGVAAATAAAPPKAPRANAAEPIGPQAPLPTGAPPVREDDEPPEEPQAGGAAVPAPQPPPAPAAPAAAEPPAEPPPPTPAVAAGPGATPALSGNVANQRQRRLLWATVRDRGMHENQLREILVEVTKQDSTGAIPAGLFDAVITTIQGVELKTYDAEPAS